MNFDDPVESQPGALNTGKIPYPIKFPHHSAEIKVLPITEVWYDESGNYAPQ